MYKEWGAKNNYIYRPVLERVDFDGKIDTNKYFNIYDFTLFYCRLRRRRNEMKLPPNEQPNEESVKIHRLHPITDVAHLHLSPEGKDLPFDEAGRQKDAQTIGVGGEANEQASEIMSCS